MSESYHTSRMRETCTSGSQEGRGETVIGICLSIRPPRLLDRSLRLCATLFCSGCADDGLVYLGPENWSGLE
jgi:hypothetical protein